MRALIKKSILGVAKFRRLRVYLHLCPSFLYQFALRSKDLFFSDDQQYSQNPSTLHNTLFCGSGPVLSLMFWCSGLPRTRKFVNCTDKNVPRDDFQVKSLGSLWGGALVAPPSKGPKVPHNAWPSCIFWL